MKRFLESTLTDSTYKIEYCLYCSSIFSATIYSASRDMLTLDSFLIVLSYSDNLNVLLVSKIFQTIYNRYVLHRKFCLGNKKIREYEYMLEKHPKLLIYHIGEDILENKRLLKNIHTLNLSLCNNVTDVSTLGDAHALNLYRCENVTDVSALGGVHTLNLTCTNITDVSALGGVHTLNLACCKNVTDASALGRVYSLDLFGCSITNVSALGGVHTLNLAYCENVTDVSMLSKVHTLRLAGCKNIINGVHKTD